MRPYFKDDNETDLFVELNLRRKQKNLKARRIRMTRKANLQEFNYFVTTTIILWTILIPVVLGFNFLFFASIKLQYLL